MLCVELVVPASHGVSFLNSNLFQQKCDTKLFSIETVDGNMALEAAIVLLIADSISMVFGVGLSMP